MMRRIKIEQFLAHAQGGATRPLRMVRLVLGRIPKREDRIAHEVHDRSFEFEIKSSPASVLIRDAVKAEKGSGTPNTVKIGKLTRDQVREIAQEKMADLNASSIESAMKTIEGTARSMGVTVEG